MKKLIGTLMIAALATSVFAQGTVAFQNQTGLVKAWTSTTDSTLVTVPKGGAYVQLISAASGTQLANAALTSFSSLSAFLTANPGWSVPDPALSSTTPALMNFGAGLFNAGTLSLVGIAGGANANYAVIGWTGNFATYDLAYAAAFANPAASFIGISAVATTATGNPGSTPPGTPVSLRPTFAGLTLAPVAAIPEPSTFALAGLGVAALLALRRRN